MSGLRRLGLRSRLALAMAAIAMAAVALSLVLFSHSVDSGLREAGRAHRTATVQRAAVVAARLFVRDGRWTPAAAAELRAEGRLAGYAFELDDAAGRPVGRRLRDGNRIASAPIAVGGRVVGRLTLGPLPSDLFRRESQTLRTRLERASLDGALLAVLLALAAAALVAATLVRPIRRLTEVADRIGAGDLDARASGGGGSEIERLGGAFNGLAATLRREDDLRRAAAADIAHELRTPVAGMVSRIEAAQDGVMADEAANLAALHREALRLARLIDDVGQLADAEQPDLLLGAETLDLAALARRRAEAHASFFAAADIRLVAPARSAAVCGDARRLEQIVDNLLSNALRYTDAGGTVVVRVAGHRGAALLEVADSGIGIEADDLPFVFDRFWRGDRSRSRATGGSGIGLAVVRELVHAHGGHVTVESAPGAGTTFRVLLPARAGSTTTDAFATLPPCPSPPSRSTTSSSPSTSWRSSRPSA